MPRKAGARLPQPLFSEPKFNEDGKPTPDPQTFRTPHDQTKDSQLYKQIGALLTKDTVSFPALRGNQSDVFQLSAAFGSHGPAEIKAIQDSGKIVLHMAGDTGASIQSKLRNELSVADHLTNDFHTSKLDDRPSFLFHLGDLIYNFGESQYYYDQFYEPFRNYAAPIFAIPGNHDSFVVPGTSANDAPLNTFMRNFCSKAPVVTKEAGSLHRTAMTQPGVYFALDAPFVRIIGLFSNALEDPGVISSQAGQQAKWPGVPNYQLNFLAAQLKRVKSEKYAGALIIAVHHPPFAYAPPQGQHGAGGHHSGSTTMLRDIDSICSAQGVYPHAFISGHVHNYQRFTRKLRFGGSEYSVPFIISGDGGHNVLSLVESRGGVTPPKPKRGARVTYLDSIPAVNSTELTIDNFDDQHYGYLRLTADNKLLRIDFHAADNNASPPPTADSVTIDIASHTLA
ncbi:MAG: metallophosphoesterase [Nitrososphaera sp.]|jgi:hypothetical protein